MIKLIMIKELDNNKKEKILLKFQKLKKIWQKKKKNLNNFLMINKNQ